VVFGVVIVLTAVVLCALGISGWARWRPRAHGSQDDDPAAVEQRVQEQIYGRRTLKVQRAAARSSAPEEALQPGEGSSELAA
jgi:hypothetical protein